MKTTFVEGLGIGISMSSVWFEEWETQIALRAISEDTGGSVVAVEFHSQCDSNQYRSNIHVAMPTPDHVLCEDDQVNSNEFKLPSEQIINA